MNPNSSAEQPPGKSMQEQARAAAEKAIVDARANYESKLSEILKIENYGERIKAKAALDKQSVE